MSMLKPTPEELRAGFEAAASECECIAIKSLRQSVYMRQITGAMRQALITVQEMVEAKPDGKKYLSPSVVIAAALCDAEGAPLYEFDVAVRWIGQQRAAVQDELFEHALRITGLGDRAVEDAEKKSSSSQSEESGTNLPSSSVDAP